MKYKQITRINPKTGALERPWRNRDHFFVLGDPAKGAVRHHDEHAVKVDNYGEALELVQKHGFSIRMSDGRSAPSLVVPSSLTISDWPSGPLDGLWTYTMPDTPFSRDALEMDIRVALLSLAGDIYWVAGSAAANAFIGFDLDISELDVGYVEQGPLPARVDLSRFLFAQVILAAYESVFHVGADKILTPEEVHELSYMIAAVCRHGGHAYPSPAGDKASPLYKTMMCAFLRWQIAEFGSLRSDYSGDERPAPGPDRSIVETLSILSGMTEQAVRNSLAREKLSAVGDKADFSALLEWLENRRDFFPFREDERPQARDTWDALDKIRGKAIREALEDIHDLFRKVDLDHPAITTLEREIAEHVENGAAVPAATLRAYARALGLNIDTFVVQFYEAVKRNNGADNVVICS